MIAPLNVTEPWMVRLFNRATPNENGCWVWQERCRGRQGYALGYGPGHKLGAAHRWAYVALVGPIPEGLEIDHLCMNPPCINPAHLEPVTRAENMRRRTAAKTHCKHGHEFTPENTRTTTAGHRQCLTCKRTYELAAYHARKSAQAAA